MSMILFLVGFMGAGKSGIGRDASRRAGVRFVDTDREVESLCGATVNEIFADRGEVEFRKLEREVLAKVVAMGGDAIVATGGGLPCEGDAMEFMNSVGRTVYIKFSPDKLLQRLLHGQARRPKLHGMNRTQMLDYIEQTLPGREAAYMRATMIVDGDRLSDDSICDYVVDYMRRTPLNEKSEHARAKIDDSDKT